MLIKKILVSFLFRSRLISKPDFVVENCKEMPLQNELEPGTMIVVGSKVKAKWLTFKCPSGCGTPLLLSLNPDHRPSWSVKKDWLQRPSVSPSVRRPDGCRCHFWVQNGQVMWCKDSNHAIE